MFFSLENPFNVINNFLHIYKFQIYIVIWIWNIIMLQYINKIILKIVFT